MNLPTALPLRTCAIVALAIGAMTSVTPSALAQDAIGEKAEFAEPRIYPLRQAPCSEALRAVTSLLQNPRGLSELDYTAFADERTNSLIVVATPQRHHDVRGLLDLIDVPGGEREAEREVLETRTVRLQHRSTAELFPVVQLHDVAVQSIAATNTFVLRGTRSELETTVALIGELDVEAEAFKLDFWVLEADAEKKIADHRELSSLTRELEKSGLEDYGVLTSASVRGVMGQRFQSEQTFGHSRVRRLDLRGRAFPGPEENARVDIDVMLQLTPRENQSNIGGSFEVETQLRTRFGNLIVLGLAPTGDASSKPLVLVLRLTE